MIKLLLFLFLFSLYPIYAADDNDKIDCSGESAVYCDLCDGPQCTRCSNEAYFLKNKDCVPCKESPCATCLGTAHCKTCPAGFIGSDGTEGELCDFCK